jgi:cytochrome c oxidase assembly protein subunit 15
MVCLEPNLVDTIRRTESQEEIILTRYWFISTKYRRNSLLALFTFGLAFVVISLGALTRLTNAGLSCPDWPNCFGFLTAPHTTEQIRDALQKFPSTAVDVKKAWTEMTHRYFAGTEGVLILILSFSILFTRKATDFKAKTIALSLILLLCIQIMLGMLTVTEKLKPVIVLSHLLTGISILSVLWWAYLDLHLHHDVLPRSRIPAWIRRSLWIGFFIVFTQITLGGWVSTHYAGLACIDFPYCNGNLLPTMQWQQLNSDLITIHMLHRIGAFITAMYVCTLAFYLRRQTFFKSIATCLLILVTVQIALGIYNIIWLRPVWIALMHQAVAILLFLTLITALVKASFIADDSHGISRIQ